MVGERGGLMDKSGTDVKGRCEGRGERGGEGIPDMGSKGRAEVTRGVKAGKRGECMY